MGNTLSSIIWKPTYINKTKYLNYAENELFLQLEKGKDISGKQRNERIIRLSKPNYQSILRTVKE